MAARAARRNDSYTEEQIRSAKRLLDVLMGVPEEKQALFTAPKIMVDFLWFQEFILEVEFVLFVCYYRSRNYHNGSKYAAHPV